MRMMFFLFFIVDLSALPTEQIQLPQALQGELPWFALVAEENGSYNGTFDIDDLKGQVRPVTKRIAISLFATYCVPCAEEFKTLSDRKAELEKNGVQVYLVDVGENNYANAKNFVEKYAGNAFPLYFDRFGNILANFGLLNSENDIKSALPLMVILDENLKPLKVLFGRIGEDFPDVLWK